jgi:tungstate transport system permease protein
MQTLWDALLQALQLLFERDPLIVEITLRSLQVSLSALVISTVLGIPLGAWLALTPLRGKSLITALVYTGMGLPPVVVGLVVYLLLSRSGPLGDLAWLFSLEGMIVAQVIIATPMIIGVTMSSLLGVDPQLRPQLQALGATPWQSTLAMLYEARFGVLVGIVAGFGAIISEVGAVMLVGGNIDGRTRVLTTAIVLEARQGNFDLALAFGLLLLGLTFAANVLVVWIQGRISRV